VSGFLNHAEHCIEERAVFTVLLSIVANERLVNVTESVTNGGGLVIFEIIVPNILFFAIPRWVYESIKGKMKGH